MGDMLKELVKIRDDFEFIGELKQAETVGDACDEIDSLRAQVRRLQDESKQLREVCGE